MPEILPRLKPDPIPAIHPVPEHAVSGRRAEVYTRTKQGLGVPWMGVVTMAFSHYPRFYDALWAGVEPIAQSRAFADACVALRAEAEAVAGTFSPPPITGRLAEMGYGPREIDEIRASNEVFSAGNMPYVLIAALARLLLEGHAWDGPADPGSNAPPEEVHLRPILIEPHHADPTLQTVYADLQAALGLPFVNTDYRAFARWPSYFAAAWGDLRTAVTDPAYPAAVAQVHDRGVALAAGLPNPTGLTPTALQAAADEDATLAEVLDVVLLFQWLLPGLATNVAFLRDQLFGTI